MTKTFCDACEVEIIGAPASAIIRPNIFKKEGEEALVICKTCYDGMKAALTVAKAKQEAVEKANLEGEPPIR